MAQTQISLISLHWPHEGLHKALVGAGCSLHIISSDTGEGLWVGEWGYGAHQQHVDRGIRGLWDEGQ